MTLAYHHMEPIALAYHPGELTVSANPGMLRRQLFHRKTSYGKDQVSGSARRKLKTRKSQYNTGGLWQLGYMALPQSREALTKVPKRPRSP
jgi:hypothetical protein